MVEDILEVVEVAVAAEVVGTVGVLQVEVVEAHYAIDGDVVGCRCIRWFAFRFRLAVMVEEDLADVVVVVLVAVVEPVDGPDKS